MHNHKSAFNLATCARPNILALKPYRCARDDYKDDGTNVLLDANENAYGPALPLKENVELQKSQQNGEVNGKGHSGPELNLRGLNRYPDPHQIELKQRLCDLRNNENGPPPPSSLSSSPRPLQPANLFVGVGSDEAIDSIIRCFCTPGRDKMLICPPTYGMYSVSAQVNDVAITTVPLDTKARFALRPDAVSDALSTNPSIKLVYLCSPGNPTGTLLQQDAIAKVLAHQSWNGIVVLDEAYVDFAKREGGKDASLASWVTAFPNLIVLQTLSKAFGLAGARIGAAFASEEVTRLLNNLKAPYNISGPTSQIALAALNAAGLEVMRNQRDLLLEQRSRLVHGLAKTPGVGRVIGGLDANFVLVEMLDQTKDGGVPSNEFALKVYEGLAENQDVVVRFRGKEYGCEGCLRISVGTAEEVDKCLRELRSLLYRLSGRQEDGVKGLDGKATDANDVVA